jgi:hypothetical protein
MIVAPKSVSGRRRTAAVTSANRWDSGRLLGVLELKRYTVTVSEGIRQMIPGHCRRMMPAGKVTVRTFFE